MNAPEAASETAPQTSAHPVCASLAGVSKLFGSFAALRQVSADLESGRCYVLIGENGAGKSTLLRILAGLLRPSFGTVKVFGGLDPQQARARIGYMSHAPMLYDELTAVENLRYFSSLYPGRPNLSPAEALRQVGLDPDLTRTLGQYSQGMRQRTSLARVLLPVPELLLLDEPFSNMDVESVSQMVKLLAGFRQGNRTIVITTHQREHAAPIADWVLALKAGRVASFEPGSPTIGLRRGGGEPGSPTIGLHRGGGEPGSPTL
ncbi:MAG TPA: ABC transporter ATP-binding protein [Terracidiphilus sp.]|nr:ABC transporter ATP-binding protein [Terracidiphilus sp.]